MSAALSLAVEHAAFKDASIGTVLMCFGNVAYIINEKLPTDPEQDRFKHEITIHISLGFCAVAEAGWWPLS